MNWKIRARDYRPSGASDGIIGSEIEIDRWRSADDLLSEARKRAVENERVLVTTLTKRMAEDLTDYLEEHGVRSYLHSMMTLSERVEIIQDLRLGEFDVLVGINLLREALIFRKYRW